MRLLAAIRRFVFGPAGPPPSSASAFSAVRDIELYGHDFEEWQRDPEPGERRPLDAELPWELREDDDASAQAGDR